MPVDINQPVFPPTQGGDILATWGDEVSEHVVQRFATIHRARRQVVAIHRQGDLCVTTDTLTLWKYDGTNWVTPLRGNTCRSPTVATSGSSLGDPCTIHAAVRLAVQPPGDASGYDASTRWNRRCPARFRRHPHHRHVGSAGLALGR